MNRIQQLSPKVISAIAAGEVIQRPVNVVKELVENSLDAKATEITILLVDTGLSKLEVVDNGHGINPKDLVLAVTPHATSKLVDLNDFKSLLSQGFRGEALSSICQVSQVTVASRTKRKESGYKIKSDFGTISKPKPLGMPSGTRITVDQLFKQTPVRQEFLKKSKAELRRILDTVTAVALTHPKVGFEIKHNDRQLLKLPPKQTLITRTESLLGSNIFSQLLPISYGSPAIRLTGFISQPSLWTKRPSKQYLFVNNRPIKHSKLQRHIHNLTNQVQANNLYPLYSLHLEINPEEIDVNIHPQKQTIDFFSLEKVQHALNEIITPLLAQRPVTYSSVGDLHYQVSDEKGHYKVHKFRRGLMSEYHKSANQKPILTGEIQQFASLYLLAPTSDGLLLVDQHALHERILYDQYKHLFKNKKKTLLKDKIQISVVFDLDAQQVLLLEENREILSDIGVEVEQFSGTSYKINTIPKILADHDIVTLIKETLEDAAYEESLQVDSQTDALLASMACRTAVKAGDYLSPEKQLWLIDQLLTKSHPGTCPHGRPVAIKITLYELHKLFKRV